MIHSTQQCYINGNELSNRGTADMIGCLHITSREKMCALLLKQHLVTRVWKAVCVSQGESAGIWPQQGSGMRASANRAAQCYMLSCARRGAASGNM